MLCLGGEAGHGIGIVHDSIWLAEINTLQKQLYPNSADEFAAVRHYYFASHDVNVEVLAEDIEWATLQQVHGW
jgi:hypothetical protein